MRAPAAWYLVAESWCPGLRQHPEGEWAAVVPRLDCQRTFFLVAFFFFLVVVVVTSKTGTNSEKELGCEAAALLYLPLFLLRFCFSSLRTSFSPLVLNSFFPP